MSDFSVEQKLELVQQIRSRYYRNQSDLMSREQILYGRTQVRRPEGEYQPASGAHAEETAPGDDTVKLRYALAAILVLLIILFDKSNTTIAGVSMEQVFTEIENDYEEVIDVWINTLESDAEITKKLLPTY